jgi:hypothetical protein
MIIALERTLAPEDMGAATCALCAEPFEQGVVYAYATTESGTEMGEVCPECIEYLGGHPSGRFPTGEDCRRLAAEWRTPLFGSAEESDRALGLID